MKRWTGRSHPSSYHHQKIFWTVLFSMRFLSTVRKLAYLRVDELTSGRGTGGVIYSSIDFCVRGSFSPPPLFKKIICSVNESYILVTSFFGRKCPKYYIKCYQMLLNVKLLEKTKREIEPSPPLGTPLCKNFSWIIQSLITSLDPCSRNENLPL